MDQQSASFSCAFFTAEQNQEDEVIEKNEETKQHVPQETAESKDSIWLGCTAGTMGTVSAWVALMGFPGVIASLLFGLWVAIYSWKEGAKIAAIVSIILNLATILFWDWVLASSRFGPILWFLH